MSEEIKKRKLYDTEAPNASTGIINGESSNVLNWDDTRYAWAYSKYKIMLGNFWIPSEINMSGDSKQWMNELTEEEKETFKKIIGLLAMLDSIQTDYAGKTADYLTDSSVSALMQVLAFQEVVHNQSYSYVLSSLVPKHEQDEVFEYWKHDEILKKRNSFIADYYEKFAENPTTRNFLKSVVFDVVLEGLFFYAGFAFFYNLARNEKMVSTSTMINYINRDEKQHVDIFTRIFKEALNENPEYDTEEMKQFVVETFQKASYSEIEWGRYIIGDKFDGITMSELEDYIKWTANLRVKQFGYKDVEPFPNAPKQNPLKWIKVFQNVEDGKSDFFEQKSRQYTKVSEDNGFDEL